MRRGVLIASGWLLLVSGFLWTRVNKPFESKVLLEVTPTHGLTDVDLPSLAAFVMAGALFVAARRRRHRQRASASAPASHH